MSGSSYAFNQSFYQVCPDRFDMMLNATRIITARWLLPISSEPIEYGFVAIKDGVIVEVGKISDLSETLQIQIAHENKSNPVIGPEEIRVITPGLVNTHLHLEQSFLAPIAKTPDETFTDWLLKVVSCLKTSSTAAEKIERCHFGVNELLKTGTTFVNDIASGTESAKVLSDRGMRGIVSLELFHPGFNPLMPDPLFEAYERFWQFMMAYPLLQAGLSPHSPYNVSQAAWRALLSRYPESRVHTHIAESVEETLYFRGECSGITQLHQQILKRSFSPQLLAETSVAALARSGLLNDKTLAAHLIEATAEDCRLLAQAGVSIAHCPRSNMALHGKTLRASLVTDSGLQLGLGTDGRLSTDDLDLRAEARCAMALHGWDAKTVLRLMTEGGAQAMGLSHAIGTLSVGKQADIVVWQAADNISATSAPPEAIVMAQTTLPFQVYIADQLRWQADQRIGH